MKLQILSWTSGDELLEDEREFYVNMYGKTDDGQSICITVPYLPWFCIEKSHAKDAVSSLMELRGLYSDEEFSFPKPVKETQIKREKFYGFNNYELFDFFKLRFQTKSDWYRAARSMEDRKLKNEKSSSKVKVYKLYEANLEPALKFVHDMNMETTGWIEIDEAKCLDLPIDMDENCQPLDKRLLCDSKDIKILDIPDTAPFVIASFDIETYSPDGSFPDPESKGCPVIQIATTFQRAGEDEPYKKVLLNLGTCDPIEGVELHTFDTEKELLEFWPEVYHKEKTDCLLGYNIWGFDLWYMWKRAEMVNADKFFYLGKSGEACELKFSKFSSSAYGDNDYKMVPTPGIFQLDLLVVMKRDHKLDSYKLDSVAEHFLNERKVDLSPKEMFAKYRGTSKDRMDIGVYCVQDTNLPLRLVWKLAIFTNLVEMAKVTMVPISYLIERGQGIKVFSQLCYQTKQENMLIETFSKTKAVSDDSAYEGATVLGALKGAYMKEPITGLDFASLYPTIIRGWNLCVSTLVFDPKYMFLEDVKYVKIDGYQYVQDRQGVLPKMLEKLAKSRKKAKKDMANAPTELLKKVFNGKQLAFKVSMNSIYGAMGSPTFQVPCKQVAACTTSKGREMIEQTKTMVEKEYPGSQVVYGDSVTGDTPLLLRDNTDAFVLRIDEITNNWQPYYGDKEYFVPNELYVWSDVGYTQIKKVIRHKTTKEMYRVYSKNRYSYVDVTSDHSLLTNEGEKISPKELGELTELLHNQPPNIHNIKYRGVKNTQKVALFMEYLNDVENKKYDVSTRKNIIQILGKTTLYVYDLETENHHFHVGPGSLIVHNTDSVMVKFPTTDIHECFRLGEEAAAKITKIFPKPVELEFEKVYHPYLLFSKKRYAGLMYTNPEKPDYIDAKGIQVVRRDNCKYVRTILQEALNCIMYEKDVTKAKDIAQKYIMSLKDGTIDINDLVVSKSLKRITYDWKGDDLKITTTYKNSNQPHVHVAENIERRERGTGPKSGDRVPYVFIQTDNPKDLQYKKAEDPLYVKQNNLQLDVKYYLEHSLMNPIESLFEVFYDNPIHVIFDELEQQRQVDLFEI